MKRLGLVSAALALCACAGDLASPFPALAVSYSSSRTIRLSQVTVNTLTSLRHLQGTSGEVKAGGIVRVSTTALKAKGATVDSLRGSFITAPPAQVHLAWSVIDDIVRPENFDSLELLSAYYNLEQARKQFAIFAPSLKLPAKPVVAHAAIADESGLSPLGLGELYYPPLAGFYLPRPGTQEQVPASMNLGAVAHALAHEAVEELVWGGAPVPAPELGADHDPLWNSARHVARSMTEGIADFLGSAATNDARWFDHSLQQVSATRALDQDPVPCSTPEMLEALPVDDARDGYNPYSLGTVLAAALWQSSLVGVQISATGVLAALPDIGARAQAAGGQLTVGAVLDALVANADVSRKPDLCGLFYNRFARLSLQSGDLPACAKVVPVSHPECQ
jgi:hypothetical protein